jgi:hypothetical protein
LPTTNHIDILGDQRHVTVILRLVLDAEDRLVYGKVLDVEARTCGSFIEWRALAQAVRACITGAKQKGPSDTP